MNFNSKEWEATWRVSLTWVPKAGPIDSIKNFNSMWLFCSLSGGPTVVEEGMILWAYMQWPNYRHVKWIKRNLCCLLWWPIYYPCSEYIYVSTTYFKNACKIVKRPNVSRKILVLYTQIISFVFRNWDDYDHKWHLINFQTL